MFLVTSIACVLLAGTVVVPGIAAAAGRQQSVLDPPLLQLNSTLETLIDQVDQTEVLRAEQLKMQEDLGKLRLEIHRLSASQASNFPTASPTKQDPATQTTTKHTDPSNQT